MSGYRSTFGCFKFVDEVKKIIRESVQYELLPRGGHWYFEYEDNFDY